MKMITALSLFLSLSACRHASGFVLPSAPSPSSLAITTSSPSSSSSSSSCCDASFNQHQRTPSTSSIPNTKLMMVASTSSSDGESSATAEISKAPTLNGKVVLPVKAMTAGLKGHMVPAVYAILNSSYKRGSGEGWEHVQHISITKDLASDISYFLNSKGSEEVAHIRALSFSYPQKATMEEFANGWKQKALGEAGVDVGDGWGRANDDGDAVAVAPLAAATSSITEGTSTVITVGDDYEFDEDDEEDMDDDDLDDYLQMMAESRSAVSSSSSPAPAPLFVDNTGLSNIASLGGGTTKPKEEDIISPFDKAVNKAVEKSNTMDDGGTELELNVANVDKVLDEVRPYLISDGGNVSVQNVDDKGDVYLLLEGACGSCASSTVTMKMGIERVLKEKFEDRLGEVIQVDPDEGEGGSGGKPTELTIESVQEEVNRISTAIVAMGGVVRVVGVDPIGVVEIEYRGPNRVKKGLELALLDVEFVKHVKFVS